MNESTPKQIIRLWYGGASRRGIARMLGINRKAVGRVLVDHENRMAGIAEVGQGHRSNLLDDFAGDLAKLLEGNPGMTAVRLHKELRDRVLQADTALYGIGCELFGLFHRNDKKCLTGCVRYCREAYIPQP